MMKNPWKKLSKINPQRNEGNRQINTEILLHLIKADLTAAEYKIIFAIIHKTWGFQKQSDAISAGQFMELTSLSKRQIKYIQKELKGRKIIHFEPSERVQRGSPLNEYLFNKHYDTWCTKRVQCSVRVHSSVKKGAIERKKRVNQSAPTIDTSTKETHRYTSGFLEFWNTYPKKVGKMAAFKAWKNLNMNNGLKETIIKSITEHCECEQWKKDNGQFIPNPSTFLNQHRWEDEITTSGRAW